MNTCCKYFFEILVQYKFQSNLVNNNQWLKIHKESQKCWNLALRAKFQNIITEKESGVQLLDFARSLFEIIYFLYLFVFEKIHDMNLGFLVGNGELPRGLTFTFPMSDQFCLELCVKTMLFLYFSPLSVFYDWKRTIIYTSAVTNQRIFSILKVGW